jgi:hypothetical protein
MKGLQTRLIFDCASYFCWEKVAFIDINSLANSFTTVPEIQANTNKKNHAIEKYITV